MRMFWGKRQREGRSPEESLLARARWVLTAQIGATITLVIALVGVVMFWVVMEEQESTADRYLKGSAERGSITNPPPCYWLFQLSGTTLTGTPAAPTVLPVRATMDRVAVERQPVVEQQTVGGIPYLIRTQLRGDTVVQSLLDLRYYEAEKRRLYWALGVSEVVGLLAALITGWLLSRRAIRPLGEALARQRRFVADASHELRAPLTQLHTRAQLLQRQMRMDASPTRMDDGLQRIVTGTRQLGEVVDDLLWSAQLRQTPRRFGTVDLAAVAQEVVTAETVRADTIGVTLELAMDPAPDGYFVNGVEPALRRVVIALVDNALGHSVVGGNVTVALRAVERGRGIQLSVRDNGVGFDPADSERIFDRFVRSDRGNGTRFGIGLALVREVVDSHGGAITATGRPGAGAEFTVTLLRSQQLPPPPPSEPGASPVPATVHTSH